MIGSFLLYFTLFASLCSASTFQFSAELERDKISIDETLSLIFTIKTSGDLGEEEPEFLAPDFEVIGQSSSLSMQSQYDSTTGEWSAHKERRIIKSLQPKKTGRFFIRSIQIKNQSKKVHAEDLAVEVFSSSVSGQLIRKNDKTMTAAGNTSSGVFVKAEINKNKDSVFKGEQIILSYYIYYSSPVSHLQIEHYPNLNGFLKEDLKPVDSNQRLKTESVLIKGVPYSRSLLAKYSIYPLQEGNLTVDPLSVRYQYYPKNRNSFMNPFDAEDLFFGFMQRSLPREESRKSESLKINVRSTPFSMPLGHFDVVSTVNKNELLVNDAVTFTVKIEGNGNILGIQEPKIQWPIGIDFYDSKGRSQTAQDGTGVKIFEFLVIPRIAAKIQLPSISFNFFDPDKQVVYQRRTSPIDLIVKETPGRNIITEKKALKQEVQSKNQESETMQLRGLHSVDEMPMKGLEERSIFDYFLNKIIILLSFFLSIVVFTDIFRKIFNKKSSQFQFKSEEINSYESLHTKLIEALDQIFKISCRSISRDELGVILIKERGLSQDLWNRICLIFDFLDQVRFSSQSDKKNQAELEKWVKESQSVFLKIGGLQ